MILSVKQFIFHKYSIHIKFLANQFWNETETALYATRYKLISILPIPKINQVFLISSTSHSPATNLHSIPLKTQHLLFCSLL